MDYTHVINYLLENDLPLIKLYKKRGLKGWNRWQNSDGGEHYGQDLAKWVTQGNDYGIGTPLRENMLVVDFDINHVTQDPSQAQLNQLNDFLGADCLDTLVSSKHGSNNKHVFYANTYNLSVNTKKQAGNVIDIFTRSQQIAIVKPYYFENLDTNKGFYEQLAPTPQAVNMWYKRTFKRYKGNNKPKPLPTQELPDQVSINLVLELITNNLTLGNFDADTGAGRNQTFFNIACEAFRNGVTSEQLQNIYVEVFPKFNFSDNIDHIINSAYQAVLKG